MIPYPELVGALHRWRSKQGLSNTGAEPSLGADAGPPPMPPGEGAQDGWAPQPTSITTAPTGAVDDADEMTAASLPPAETPTEERTGEIDISSVDMVDDDTF